MHVAYVHQHFTTQQGASGTRSYEMGQRLRQAGHKVTLIVGAHFADDLGGGSKERVKELDIEGLRVMHVNEQYSSAMGFVRRVQSFRRFADTATKVVYGLDADLVFASSTPLTVGITGMKGARRLGVPFVFEVRDLWPELAIAMGVVKNPLLKMYLQRLERKIYSAADWIIALAPGMKEGICRTGYPAERVTLVPNASDIDLFKPSSEKLNDERFGDPDGFRLVFTGAHGPAKRSRCGA